MFQADGIEFDDKVAGHDLVGQKVGSFEIVKIIGRGGMGVVYLARDSKLKRSVAIKSIPSELQADSNARTRFRREAELLASLNHPNIGVIHEIIEEEQSGYLVLEYVPGETLSERIARKPLNLEEALSIGRQVAEAISAAHQKGIVHRDLKPGNIKITPEGRVKVLDFGLAKVPTKEGKSSDITVTQPGLVIGTPAYMSPEQARGESTDHRTDIWSFGCIMYQMLAGHLPFEADTATDTLARIIEREPNWELLPQNTPANIRVLLRRCLEKDPPHRLQHIGDAVLEISETQHPPTTVRPVILHSKLRKRVMVVGVVFIIALSGLAAWFALTKQPQPSSKEIRLVVLPFDNLGPAEDEMFADGMTAEIAGRLSGIPGLSVISRKSAMQYKNVENNVQQISQELRVDYILEGTIQREKPLDPNSQVRIQSQLIRASDDTQIWSKTYNGDMSEIFHLQFEFAEQVAQGLDITLLARDRKALASSPTENAEAYSYYLNGNEYFHQVYLKKNFEIAINMYKKAIELDHNFALAYVKLSIAHSHMYWFHHDHSNGRIQKALEAIHKALEIAPDQPEIHMAYGWYYYLCHLDYEDALEQFATARKKRPNLSFLLEGISAVQRRMGNFDQSIMDFKKAFNLNPRSSRLAREIGRTYELMRNYSEAELYIDRAIHLAPDQPHLYASKAQLYLLWEGGTEKARTVLEEALQNIGSLEDAFIARMFVLLNLFDGNYQEALTQLSSWKLEAFESQFYFIPRAQLYAQINGLLANRQLEQSHYESARSILETKIQEQPDDARFHSSLGIAYAGLGRKQDAIREGELAVELLPVSKEALQGFYRAKDLAQIYTMVGEHDAAIDQIEYLLSIPGELSIPLLKLDPAWNPLRNHPRFQKLIKSDK
ncbi:protein kinase [Planctomycetota bacterium]